MRRVAIFALLVEIGFHSTALAEESTAEAHRHLIGLATFGGLLGDFAFTTFAVRGQPFHDRWLGGLEVGVTLPQVPALLYVAIDNPFDLGTTERALLIVASAWPLWLTGHGIWSLAVGSGEPPPPMHRAATWGPTVVTDGLQLAPALGVAGRF
jgi:hypothetical protein